MRKTSSGCSVTVCNYAIRGILAISQSDGDGGDLQKQDANELIVDVLAMCSRRLRLEQIEVLEEFAAGPTWCVCSGTSTRQILVNIVSNAIDALSDRSLKQRYLKLEIRDVGEFIAIVVTNSGAIIPDDIKSKIMTPFFTTKRQGAGTGIGLSISKRLAEMQGGNLYLDPSNPLTSFVLEIKKAPHIS